MKRPCLLLLLIAAGCRQPHANIVFPPGGYAYPTASYPADSDYYCLPFKTHLHGADSFLFADVWQIYKPFGEPNLSRAPKGEPVFRFVYSPGYYYPTVILLKENELVVKHAVNGVALAYDDGRLTNAEYQRYSWLQRYYLSSGRGFSPSRQRYFDSMMKSFPPMADPAYYVYLRDKRLPPGVQPYTYSTRKVSLTPGQYSHLLMAINNAGYWKLPLVLPCSQSTAVMDGAQISLEANTPQQYNFVGFKECDTVPLPIAEACQLLVNYAGEGKKIRFAVTKDTPGP